MIFIDDAIVNSDDSDNKLIVNLMTWSIQYKQQMIYDDDDDEVCNMTSREKETKVCCDCVIAFSLNKIIYDKYEN